MLPVQNVVCSMIKTEFSNMTDIDIISFEPVGILSSGNIPVRTEHPKMTTAGAFLIQLMQQYSEMLYRLTLLEIQKLAYFLQESGERLRLQYKEGRYGPYAHNLNKFLEVLESHYIKGYGDNQKLDVEIELLPGAAEEADSFLKKREESTKRLKRVSEVIEGFETPYGMELLSSVHWVATYRLQPAKNAEEAIAAICGCTPQKNKLFQVDHIQKAWVRLEYYGWLGAS